MIRVMALMRAIPQRMYLTEEFQRRYLENPLDFFHGARYDNYIACPDKKRRGTAMLFPSVFEGSGRNLRKWEVTYAVHRYRFGNVGCQAAVDGQ